MKAREGMPGRLVSASANGKQASRTLQSQVVHQLGVAIVGGEFAPGTLLPTDSELIIRFGVSRTVLRESMKALAAKNIVNARARVGTRVLPRRDWSLFDPDVLAWHFEVGPDITFLRSLAEIRVGIELEAAALAAQRRTQVQLERLMADVEGMAGARDADSFAGYDLDFHRTLAEAADNLFMASINGLVDLALSAAFTISSPVDDPEAHKVTVQNHRRIAQAIHDAAPEDARAAMRLVIAEGFDRAAGRMSGGPSGSGPSQHTEAEAKRRAG
ncbi:FadR/GntR family transcriptional regulator [Devosia sp.]|uniref:FadR/GntR family transcriptional regulator n=1 Tax=Devosia sp. TaxID=1871048 RepID=UPI003A9471CA